MTLAAGMGPSVLDGLPKGQFTFTDAEAADRLVNRVCRQMAEVMDAGDECFAKDLLPIYQWLNALIADDLREIPTDLKEQVDD